jgi:hypothetical protein
MAPQLAGHTAQQYRLKDSTIAIVSENSKDIVIRVPAGSTITVLDNLRESDRPNREVRARWIGKDLRMFAVDILERGQLVSDCVCRLSAALPS